MWDGLDWGRTWLDWTGLGWAAMGCTGLDWVALGWTGLDWAGQAGLGWAGVAREEKKLMDVCSGMSVCAKIH